MGIVRVIFIFILFCVALPFRIDIKDTNPLLGYIANVELDAEIYFSLSEQHLIEGRLCIAINGTTCHCFDDAIPTLRLIVPSVCITQLPYYLSFIIHYYSLHLVSSTANPQSTKYHNNATDNCHNEHATRPTPRQNEP